MSLVASSKGKSSFPIMDAGAYAAVCYGIIDEGTQHNENYNNDSYKVRIMWEFPSELIEIDGEMKPRVQSKEYTLSLGDKAALKHDLESWRGKAFTQAELQSFNLANLVGAPCFINIIHKVGSNGNTYANIGSIMPIPKGMQPPVMTMDPVVFDMQDSPLNTLAEIPAWIGDIIKKSPEFKERAKKAQAEVQSQMDLVKAAEAAPEVQEPNMDQLDLVGQELPF